MACKEMTRIDEAVHDLCQPITTLQCHLEMAGLLHTPEAYCDAVQAALMECERIAAGMGVLREAIRSVKKLGEGMRAAESVDPRG